RAEPVVGRGQQRRLDAEGPGEARRHRRERLAGHEGLRPYEVQAEVEVAELEPRFAAEPLDRLERVPRLPGAAPAALLVREARERVEDAVEVGRDMEPEH